MGFGAATAPNGDDLPLYLKNHWSSIRSQLLDGTYRPEPVLRVEIPKAGGGVRALGIPPCGAVGTPQPHWGCSTAGVPAKPASRGGCFIQQAVLQVLQAAWDPTFSDASYGFRPGRSAHQAVARAQEHIADGYGWVVDLDLEKFPCGAAGSPQPRFDRVNHDILMRLPPRSPDRVHSMDRIEGLLAFDGQTGHRPAYSPACP